VNPCFLTSLPWDHFVSGLMEIVKLSFFDCAIARGLKQIDIADLQMEPVKLLDLVLQAAIMKLKLFEQDPYELDQAALFLYGHPFANVFEPHSWETTGRYMPHGYAVALGMLFSAWLADSQDCFRDPLMETHQAVIGRVLDVSALIEQYPLPRTQVFRSRLIRDKYCCGSELRVPCLCFDTGFASLPLGLVVEQYDGWRQHFSAVTGNSIESTITGREPCHK